VLAEITGNELYFHTMDERGRTVDSGVIQRREQKF
jgi:hypothetical protein